MELTEKCNYEKILDEETPQAERIAEYLMGYGVTDVLDVGCGPGNYVKEMRKRGINAFGVDIDDRAINEEHCIISDITNEDPLHKYAVVLSLEVGEHIPEDKSWDYIRYIARCEPTMIMFSAALHGQGGDGHINCQNKSYWAARFRWYGYKYDPIATEDFVNYMRNGYHMGWLLQNVMIFN